MQFIYHENAGATQLTIEGETYQHLYKSRRTKTQETLSLRNLKDDFLYRYQHQSITRKEATITLIDKTPKPVIPTRYTHLILAVFDQKEFYKILPSLNELGVGKLTLFFAHFSQREKLDCNKIHKILIYSSQQCGRSNLMHIEILENLDDVLAHYPKIGVFDFGGTALTKVDLPILIGPEGGLSPQEREILKDYPTFSTQQDLILKSQSACLYVASTLL
ncbi:16S rRNA (uracil(1498)-N(3))-methyltransferase [Helicobacter enhydrae]|uniref:Ribosomal RNA small subunit methyltransferase E n=1 Tax=Helicobacter enhydrae TaxID=222136 RepID=A0A1B1U4P0_9HELI|nr:16S rRNA (uracil(1498)-N(3))-methyltransferase [Helicobacter enhydrae]ANV97720.1 16S rRNA (uracil(1498)-N(3))-methyltransferase [Helicobacter enhydrae]